MGLNRIDAPQKRGGGAGGRPGRLLIDTLRELGWGGPKAGGRACFRSSWPAFLRSVIPVRLMDSWAHEPSAPSRSGSFPQASASVIGAPLGPAVYANRRGETLSDSRPFPSRSALKPVNLILLMAFA